MTGSQVYTVTDKVRFIEGAFGRGDMARNCRNFAIWCPMCAPKDRSKKKLVIRLDDDANHCWTCTWRARSLAPLLKKFASTEDLIKYRDTFMSEGVRRYWVDVDETIERKQITLPRDFTMLSITSQKTPDTRTLLRYVGSRGISVHDMWRFRLGQSSDPRWSRRVLVPSFAADGTLNYLVGRAVDRQKIRYENEDVDKTSIVFNELNVDWSSRLVLCEGPFDLMKCGDNATCLLGSTLNEGHLLFDRIISNNTPVALALDPAAAGNALWIAKKLAEYDIDVKVVDLTGHEDPGSMTKEAFKTALDNAESYNWMMKFRHKITGASRVLLSS